MNWRDYQSMQRVAEVGERFVSQHTPAKGGGLMSVTASKAVGLMTLIFAREHACAAAKNALARHFPLARGCRLVLALPRSRRSKHSSHEPRNARH